MIPFAIRMPAAAPWNVLVSIFEVLMADADPVFANSHAYLIDNKIVTCSPIGTDDAPATVADLKTMLGASEVRYFLAAYPGARLTRRHCIELLKPNSDPVSIGHLYLVNGAPTVSQVSGTVADLKAATGGNEIRAIDMESRFHEFSTRWPTAMQINGV